jgi:hypothetical protein
MLVAANDFTTLMLSSSFLQNPSLEFGFTGQTVAYRDLVGGNLLYGLPGEGRSESSWIPCVFVGHSFLLRPGVAKVASDTAKCKSNSAGFSRISAV